MSVRLRFSREQPACATCHGTGNVFVRLAGAGRLAGGVWETCAPCDGTGEQPNAAPVAFVHLSGPCTCDGRMPTCGVGGCNFGRRYEKVAA